MLHLGEVLDVAGLPAFVVAGVVLSGDVYVWVHIDLLDSGLENFGSMSVDHVPGVVLFLLVDLGQPVFASLDVDAHLP